MVQSNFIPIHVKKYLKKLVPKLLQNQIWVFAIWIGPNEKIEFLMIFIFMIVLNLSLAIQQYQTCPILIPYVIVVNFYPV